MRSNNPEEVDAMRHLEEIVDELGLAYVVYLLADIAEQQSDVLLKKDDIKAARLAHDAKVLARTAIVLLG
jgi:hypothetical protein